MSAEPMNEERRRAIEHRMLVLRSELEELEAAVFAIDAPRRVAALQQAADLMKEVLEVLAATPTPTTRRGDHRTNDARDYMRSVARSIDDYRREPHYPTNESENE